MSNTELVPVEIFEQIVETHPERVVIASLSEQLLALLIIDRLTPERRIGTPVAAPFTIASPWIP